MLVFSCLVPHPPLLIPEVGKENLEKLKETKNAFEALEADLYSAKPEVIIVISPHTNNETSAFTINQQPQLKIDFKDFGDLLNGLEFSNELGLGYQIKEAVETRLPVILTSQSNLDYGAGVPLFYLTKHLPKIKIIPIGLPTVIKQDKNEEKVDYEKYLQFGVIIKEMVNKSSQRIAIVASGDLSHKLHQDSPAGYSPRGQEFDQTLIRLLQNKKTKDIINLDKSLIDDAGECGFGSLLILLGVIRNLNFEPKKLSYQAPFGIGYLVENFELK